MTYWLDQQPWSILRSQWTQVFDGICPLTLWCQVVKSRLSGGRIFSSQPVFWYLHRPKWEWKHYVSQEDECLIAFSRLPNVAVPRFWLWNEISFGQCTRHVSHYGASWKKALVLLARPLDNFMPVSGRSNKWEMSYGWNLTCNVASYLKVVAGLKGLLAVEEFVRTAPMMTALFGTICKYIARLRVCFILHKASEPSAFEAGWWRNVSAIRESYKYLWRRLYNW